MSTKEIILETLTTESVKVSERESGQSWKKWGGIAMLEKGLKIFIVAAQAAKTKKLNGINLWCGWGGKRNKGYNSVWESVG